MDSKNKQKMINMNDNARLYCNFNIDIKKYENLDLCFIYSMTSICS